MKTEFFKTIYESALKETQITPKKDTPYYKLAGEILEMALAYRDDGITFLNSGDRVNAHAAFCYGFGWLDFGIGSGLINGNIPKCRIPVFSEDMPKHLTDHLSEKTTRYFRMLTEACDSVESSPDKESPLHSFTEKIYALSMDSVFLGDAYLKKDEKVNALAHFSYGYGWLDAAVRAGLFKITDKRELFTV
ncbi:DUF357 domain-containing protein [Methanoplanus sp. FWC-SCC4]|uniref:DUF357 domain-containing protein n=1 Tax=Methanochimaera problematica TaxID=2609417 RepID=A0AA97FDH6_9EURY|nr:DUF357 domain-containing protein [Methanoplanus sp. FWC-SCC4]WOF16532.1 DUF357 domain-containing protein [Methanoplanus sp. FWC-SCC4]